MNIKMRKLLLNILIILSMSIMISCGEEEEKPTETVNVTGYTSKEIHDTLMSAMKDMPEMDMVTSDDTEAKAIFMVISDMDYSKIEDYVFSYSKVGLADEVIVIHTKNIDDIEEIKKDLQSRLKERRRTYEGYNPEQLVKFDGATVITKDNCAVLLIGNQAQDGKSEFDKLFDK